RQRVHEIRQLVLIRGIMRGIRMNSRDGIGAASVFTPEGRRQERRARVTARVSHCATGINSTKYQKIEMLYSSQLIRFQVYEFRSIQDICFVAIRPSAE